jgi:2-amino-4-hydroxy-6-hydroxymethyldihydropteridine diphosphokinase
MTNRDTRIAAGRHDLSFLGLGANLPHPVHGSPEHTLEAMVGALSGHGFALVRRSSWYESAPVPMADQPWYVNGVVAVRSQLSATELLAQLHALETEFGRVRTIVNAPRVVDLDLLDHRGEQWSGDDGGPVVPHPRMTERAFVLLPLREIAPEWRHPVTGAPIDQLITGLSHDQITRRLGSA